MNFLVAQNIFMQGKKPSKYCLFCYPPDGMVLWETLHFRVLIDTYPIVPGHIMISSKGHFGSAGEIPDFLRQEYHTLKTEVRKYVERVEQGAIFYEHGKAGACHALHSQDVHCEHFHIHCLPVNCCIYQEISRTFTGISINEYAQIYDLFSAHGTYLFFENSKKGMTFFPADEEKVPAHFLRTLMCQRAGVVALADWHAYQDYERYLSSLAKISEMKEGKKAYALF